MSNLLPKLSLVRQEQHHLAMCICILTHISSTKLFFNLQFLLLDQAWAGNKNKIQQQQIPNKTNKQTQNKPPHSDNLLKVSVTAQPFLRWLPKGASLRSTLLTSVVLRLYLLRGFTAEPIPVFKMIDEFSFLMYGIVTGSICHMWCKKMFSLKKVFQHLLCLFSSPQDTLTT